jgi:hypothetical protein
MAINAIGKKINLEAFFRKVDRPTYSEQQERAPISTRPRELPIPHLKEAKPSRAG